MQYLGGKSKIAKTIVSGMLEEYPETTHVWDAFCGGLSISKAFAQAGKQVLASDENLALISMYKAAASGWDPPIVTEEMYHHAKTLPDTDPLKALAGFGCSFGAKWFGGWARSAQGQDYPDIARRVVAKDAACVQRFARIDFLALPAEAEPGLLIYCDPPYAGTTGYRQGAFNHEAFWQRCRDWVSVGVPIFVSEYTAPDDFVCVWTKEQTTKMGRTEGLSGKEQLRRECLFHHRSQVYRG